jgi:pimeloyl-ACP methyl ester carboxylesterase
VWTPRVESHAADWLLGPHVSRRPERDARKREAAHRRRDPELATIPKSPARRSRPRLLHQLRQLTARNGDPAPAGLSAKEKAAFESMNRLYTKGAGYAWMMVTRPQTLAYGLSDSPAGLAAFFYDKVNDWTYSAGDAEKVLTRDEMLDDITLYWLTNTAGSSAQLYWENNNNNFNAVEQKTADISVPVAVTVFPGEIYQAPRSWAERAYLKLIYFNEVNKGGHFAAWEEPELFARELRAAFKSLR